MPEIRIKVLTVSDIHSWRVLYAELRAAVEFHQPHIVACVGDMLDFEGTSRGMATPEECARELAGLPCEQIVFVRGNHEFANWDLFGREWARTGKPLTTLHGEALTHGPLVILGFPCLLGDEDAFRGARPQLGHPEEWLPPLEEIHGEALRTLWLMHEPPLGTPYPAEAE